MWIRSLGQEDPLEEGMATHSSILAWRILWSLSGYRPQRGKELGTTDVTENARMHSNWNCFLGFMSLFS